MPNVVVAEAFDLAHTQAGPIDDAGVIFLIEDDDVFLAYQRADRAKVDLHAG